MIFTPFDQSFNLRLVYERAYAFLLLSLFAMLTKGLRSSLGRQSRDYADEASLVLVRVRLDNGGPSPTDPSERYTALCLNS